MAQVVKGTVVEEVVDIYLMVLATVIRVEGLINQV